MASETKPLAPLPTSTATNAYDLLSDICALVLEEPKRLHMNFWKFTTDDAFVPDEQMPTCGTVACIGGWVDTLRPEPTARGDQLGLTREQRLELFYPQNLLDEAGDPTGGIGQTVEHARHVVAHIAAFQQKYAEQLKAKAV